MKKVLIVAYHFPPSDAVGALRPAKFAEYLPEFGWEPTVLTAPAEESDSTWQFAEVPDVRKHTVSAWPGLRQLWRGLRRLLGTAQSAGEERRARESSWKEDFARARARGDRFVRLREFAYSAMWLPDDCQGWIIPAVIRGFRLIQRDRPDAIMATSPPHSAQVVGLLLSRLTGLPLVADFRDPWIDTPTMPEYARKGITHRLHASLEELVLDTARRVVTATSRHADALNGRVHLDGKLVSIANGFDARSFEGIKQGGSRRFTITYVGNFYHTRTPVPLLDAASLLARRGVITAAEIEIRLVGGDEFVEGRRISDLAEERGLGESVVLTGRLAHREALRELAAADLLLLLAIGQPDQIPTKAYEYLAAGRPVLALVDEGATARLMERAEADVLYEPNAEAIARVLRSRIERWSPPPAVSWSCPPAAAPFERRSAARALGDVLTELSAS